MDLIEICNDKTLSRVLLPILLAAVRTHTDATLTKIKASLNDTLQLSRKETKLLLDAAVESGILLQKQNKFLICDDAMEVEESDLEENQMERDLKRVESTGSSSPSSRKRKKNMLGVGSIKKSKTFGKLSKSVHKHTPSQLLLQLSPLEQMDVPLELIDPEQDERIDLESRKADNEEDEKMGGFLELDAQRNIKESNTNAMEGSAVNEMTEDTEKQDDSYLGNTFVEGNKKDEILKDKSRANQETQFTNPNGNKSTVESLEVKKEDGKNDETVDN